MGLLLVGALAVAVAVAGYFGLRARDARREAFIRGYTFPKGLFDRLAKARPELAFKDIALTSHALRQFFLAYLRSGRRYVSMPSQVADDLWHEFILYTRNYELFCRQAFGGFLHHTPAVALSADRPGNAGLRRTWWCCCREENIDPRRPSRLPLLFALDGKLGIADGFRYKADCGQRPGQIGRDDGATTIYCGTSFGDSTFDGSGDGFGDFDVPGPGTSGDVGFTDAGSSDGGSCGGGCGGGGGD